MTDGSLSPFDLFGDWFAEAEASEPNEPTAMALATATADGRPSVRMVLLKKWDDRGFVFYTNLESRKGQEIAENPHAALCFHWKSLRKQIRIEGPLRPVPPEEADAYFASRARDSRIGAWASQQSRPMEGMFRLEREVAKYAAKFGLGEIPRPPFWSGFRLVPERIEFWHDRQFRLHDRQLFEREGDSWTVTQLFP
ncbi:pyridoxamine 5'-phosphate oxidase [Govanella unica]|uniref:Pyridoxine/pyridoxamine 5'-phosphate oxidase n=1 Tax=Govanella unica TaxID=2975056 RepID=A0A9X3TYC9_9PROT|nr:pyridoxamine 5'-phosphate oxidase [Govania unica]MDA5194038.1 pyridoxamine 5'-phosphate oxidase [Govania unica]